MQQPQFVEQRDPEDVFALLSDDNRVGILRALWGGDEPMTFSELHDAVGIDDSGQFNYHLDKLVGQFVSKTDEGYHLAAAGSQINGAIESGSYTATGSMEPIELDRLCPTCGGTRTFYYEDERARVDCDGCEVKAQFAVPPGTFADRDREAIPEVAGKYLRVIVERLGKGFCSKCDGPVEYEVCSVVDTPMWDDTEAEGVDDEMSVDPSEVPMVQYECLQCGLQPTSGLTSALLDNPAVVSFYHDHGIDIQERSIWEFALFGTNHEAVQSTDPFRASTIFSVDGETLTVVVDSDLRVVDTSVEKDT